MLFLMKSTAASEFDCRDTIVQGIYVTSIHAAIVKDKDKNGNCVDVYLISVIDCNDQIHRETHKDEATLRQRLFEIFKAIGKDTELATTLSEQMNLDIINKANHQCETHQVQH